MTILSYQEAKSFFLTVDFRPISKNTYDLWKAINKPLNLPDDPITYYGTEWKGWWDFLTYDTYMPLEEAMAYIQSVQPPVKYLSDFYDLVNDGVLPINFPISPISTYRYQWKDIDGWNGFLGLRMPIAVSPQFLPYHEAVEVLRHHKIEGSARSYYKIIKQLGIKNIPVIPVSPYQNFWLSWEDFFGYDNFLVYDEAKLAVKYLNITSEKQLKDFQDSGMFNVKFPLSISHAYTDHGYSGQCDFFGVYKRWNVKILLQYLKSIRPIIKHLQPSELYAILSANGSLAAATRVVNNQPVGKIMDSIIDGKFHILADNPDDETTIPITNAPIAITHKTTIEELLEEEELDDSLPELPITAALKKLDLIHRFGSDEETVEFIINNGVRTTWNNVLNAKDQTEIDGIINNLNNYKGGIYATTLQDRFLEQYNGSINLEIPEGYSFTKNGISVEPNLMQKLVAYMLSTKNRIGNWSGTGSGKSLSSILASRVANAKFTVIIALNGTLPGWEDEILNAYPDSNVIVKEKRDFNLSTTQPNYLLLNYESFQTYSSPRLVHHLLDEQIDMIVLDEIHRTKASTLSKDANAKLTDSRRRQIIADLLHNACKHNPVCKILGLSATPILNNLQESVSLLELITQKKYPDLITKPTIDNALAIHQQLVINGLRYKPKYETMHLSERTVEINVQANISIIDNLKATNTGNLAAIERQLIPYKLDTIVNECQPGTIIFSQYVNDLIHPIYQAITAAGFSCGIYTGENKTGLEEFINGNVDVLIGSSVIGTGIDGLQYVCNKMIITNLPWTSADYEQLIGRIFRQGSIYNSIEIVIPEVVLHYDNETWSWDKQRLARIKYKRTLTDAALDGYIPNGILMSKHELTKESIKALDKWIERLESNGVNSTERDSTTNYPVPVIDKPILKMGDFTRMNRRICSTSSYHTHMRLSRNPSEFYTYHALYTKARTTWKEIPYLVIAEKIMKIPNCIVADFGCGENLLSKEIPNQVHAFDHIAVDDNVIACDIAKTPLDDNSVDLVVLSLALMGINWKDYLLEAKRVLKVPGYLCIAEPTKTWQDDNYKELTDAITKVGFLCKSPHVSVCGKFVYIDSTLLPF